MCLYAFNISKFINDIVKAFHCNGSCCDRKTRAASPQSFALWQQATTEITCHDHSIIACWSHICMGAVLRAHLVRDESHIQRNANREVATVLYADDINLQAAEKLMISNFKLQFQKHNELNKLIDWFVLANHVSFIRNATFHSHE